MAAEGEEARAVYGRQRRKKCARRTVAGEEALGAGAGEEALGRRRRSAAYSRSASAPEKKQWWGRSSARWRWRWGRSSAVVAAATLGLQTTALGQGPGRDDGGEERRAAEEELGQRDRGGRRLFV